MTKCWLHNHTETESTDSLKEVPSWTDRTKDYQQNLALILTSSKETHIKPYRWYDFDNLTKEKAKLSLKIKQKDYQIEQLEEAKERNLTQIDKLDKELAKQQQDSASWQVAREITIEKNKEEIFEAIEKGNIELFKEKINEIDKDINNIRDDSNNTLMHVAAKENNLEMLKLLISKGGDINAKNKYDLSVLHSVASGIANKRQNWDIVEWFLQQKGLDFEAKTKGWLTVQSMFLDTSEHLLYDYEDLLDRLFQEGKIEYELKYYE